MLLLSGWSKKHGVPVCNLICLSGVGYSGEFTLVGWLQELELHQSSGRNSDMDGTVVELPTRDNEKQQSDPSHSIQGALRLLSTKGLLHDCVTTMQTSCSSPWSAGIPWSTSPSDAWTCNQTGPGSRFAGPFPVEKCVLWIHVSAICRMEADLNYCSGNLIVKASGKLQRVGNHGVGGVQT